MFRRFLEQSSGKQTEKRSNDSEEYCVIRWTDRTTFDIVHQRNIRAAPQSILVYETYTVEMDGRQRKGTVLLKGTKADCEKLQYNVTPKVTPKVSPTASPRASPTSQAKPKKPEHEPVRTASSSASAILADVQGTSREARDDKEEEAIRNEVLGKILQMILSTNTGNDSDSGEKHKVQCSACGENPIESDRYKCLNCGDLNFCADCFEARRESSKHKSGHAFVHFKSPGELFGRPVTESEVTYSKLKQTYADDVHESITCDGCTSETIKGLRFKCDTCPNYDLCQRCVDRGITTKTHQSSHPLIVIPRRAIQQIPLDDIKIGDEIGSGAFGSVYKATWISKKRLVACKVIIVPQKAEAEALEKSFLKEIAAYAELSGAYILKIYGFAAARQGQNKVYMVIMEYMSHGSLASVIKDKGDLLSLRRRLNMARNIASGIRKIHEHGMIHRDIRPDNILVNENFVAKIGDMGIARVKDPRNQHTQIGCQPYMPPEFYKGSYDQKLDIFTFGLTLNELFTSTRHSFQPFVSDKIAFQEKSPIFDDLIARCTAHDPQRRPAAIEIEKTFDLYAAGFNEIVLKKHPGYQKLSKEDKDEIFVAFYEQFHDPAADFIRKKFPREFLEDSTDVGCVKVDKEAGEGIRIQCPVQ